MTRHYTRQDIPDHIEAALDCWLVYHGINLHEAVSVEFTGYRYMVVQYRDDPISQAISFQVEPPV
jgi:hypothetical protein